MKIHNAPLAKTIEELKNEEQSLSEYIEEFRDRVEEIDPKIEALVDPPEWERLKEEAAELEKRKQEESLPLYGALLAPKDIINVDGFPTKANSDLPPKAFDGPESEAVTTLKEAGALVLAKADCTEMALRVPCDARNPYNLDHTPGGSSSGSGSAVGAGICHISLGTQTTGSNNRPAAFCGTVGFKPTHERISTKGVMERSASLDHVGILTQDIEGMELVASVVCEDWSTEDVIETKPTLGIPIGTYLDKLRVEGEKAFNKHIHKLESEEYKIKQVDLFDNIDEEYELHGLQNSMETALSHHERYEEYDELYSDTFSEFVIRGRDQTVEKLGIVRDHQNNMRESIEATMQSKEIDAWIFPPALGTAPEGLAETGSPYMQAPWTRTGMPAITLPGGFVNGLPVGLQIATFCGEDEQLLAWADQISPIVDNSVDLEYSDKTQTTKRNVQDSWISEMRTDQ